MEQKATSLKSLGLSVGFFPIVLSPILTRTPASLLLMAIGGFAGITAILTGCGSNSASESPTPTPMVTSASSEDIENYARAILAIEQIRQAASEEIQKMTNNETIPDVTCTKPESLAALSKNIQGIAVNYCERAKKFIDETEGLTMDKFNEITSSAQSNPELQQRIQTELVRLQGN
ncbi:DUF4168 domain-containing protein [Allocoleopsis franciscana]|uniref:DUF4168 domain-containing protein n=1 Tax=Allocoleopsis franciscana PCC 7113 TaxID=1173027 RepID=K9WDD8_9CYAN|nr:DUF4168 domain-containing protein [Allocoleopsis franciscana]AFZ17764.1 hypothetical protein Mic7113_1910 [Allocoleopsis franciscana PCC 7113]